MTIGWARLIITVIMEVATDTPGVSAINSMIITVLPFAGNSATLHRKDIQPGARTP